MSSTAPVIPLENQKCFELQHPGDVRHPFETEWVSLSELIRRRVDGRLNGREYVRWSSEATAILVETVLQRASAGNLWTVQTEATPKPKKRAKTTRAQLEAAIATCRASESELTRNQALLSGSGHKLSGSPCEELHRLETAGDLSDPKVLGRLSELRSMAETLPHRVQACSQAHSSNLRSLLSCCQEFIADSFRQKLDVITDRTRAKVAAAIGEHFSAEELGFHVERSALFVQLTPIHGLVTTILSTYDQDAAPTLAAKLLDADSAADVFEREKLAA